MSITDQSTLPIPSIIKVTSEHARLLFTMTNVDVSVANAFRRTILTDIPVVCIQTETNATNQAKVTVNTSRTHNELLLHRISSVPIHATDPEFCNKYQLEIDMVNAEENGVISVTTEHFRLRQLTESGVGELIPELESRKVFPADPITQCYIDIVDLRPAVGSIPGERVTLTARFSWATTNSGERQTANTSYGYTVDEAAAAEAWEKHEHTILADNPTMVAADLQTLVAGTKRDFYHLDARRIFVLNSFDFWVESFGVYSNQTLMAMTSNILRKKLQRIIVDVDSGALAIVPSSEVQTRGYLGVIESTMANSWDIILEGEGDTIGNMLNYAILTLFFNVEANLREVTYCAHKKFHPDHSFGILRVALKDNDQLIIRRILKHSCSELTKVVDAIKKI